MEKEEAAVHITLEECHREEDLEEEKKEVIELTFTSNQKINMCCEAGLKRCLEKDQERLPKFGSNSSSNEDFAQDCNRRNESGTNIHTFRPSSPINPEETAYMCIQHCNYLIIGRQFISQNEADLIYEQLINAPTNRDWSRDELRLLQYLVVVHCVKNRTNVFKLSTSCWQEIASLIPQRQGEECENKWWFTQFSWWKLNEDHLLQICYHKQGIKVNKKWTEVARDMNSVLTCRTVTPKECYNRYRFYSYLRTRNEKPLSPHKTLALLTFYIREGTNWETIARSIGKSPEYTKRQLRSILNKEGIIYKNCFTTPTESEEYNHKIRGILHKYKQNLRRQKSGEERKDSSIIDQEFSKEHKILENSMAQVLPSLTTCCMEYFTTGVFGSDEDIMGDTPNELETKTERCNNTPMSHSAEAFLSCYIGNPDIDYKKFSRRISNSSNFISHQRKKLLRMTSDGVDEQISTYYKRKKLARPFEDMRRKTAVHLFKEAKSYLEFNQYIQKKLNSSSSKERVPEMNSIGEHLSASHTNQNYLSEEAKVSEEKYTSALITSLINPHEEKISLWPEVEADESKKKMYLNGIFFSEGISSGQQELGAQNMNNEFQSSIVYEEDFPQKNVNIKEMANKTEIVPKEEISIPPLEEGLEEEEKVAQRIGQEVVSSSEISSEQILLTHFDTEEERRVETVGESNLHTYGDNYINVNPFLTCENEIHNIFAESSNENLISYSNLEEVNENPDTDIIDCIEYTTFREEHLAQIDRISVLHREAISQFKNNAFNKKYYKKEKQKSI